jgi:hypothetical protein
MSAASPHSDDLYEEEEEDEDQSLLNNNFFDYQIPKGRRRRQVPRSQISRLAADELLEVPSHTNPSPSPDKEQEPSVSTTTTVNSKEQLLRRRVALEISPSTSTAANSPYLVQQESHASDLPRWIPCMLIGSVILLLLLILLQVGSVFSNSILHNLH